jgi:hypothetical protein
MDLEVLELKLSRTYLVDSDTEELMSRSLAEEPRASLFPAVPNPVSTLLVASPGAGSLFATTRLLSPPLTRCAIVGGLGGEWAGCKVLGDGSDGGTWVYSYGAGCALAVVGKMGPRGSEHAARSLAEALVDGLRPARVVVLGDLEVTSYVAPDADLDGHFDLPRVRSLRTAAEAKARPSPCAVPVLERPNLARGVTAAMLSLCEERDLPCQALITLRDRDLVGQRNVNALAEPLAALLPDLCIAPAPKALQEKVHSEGVYM